MNYFKKSNSIFKIIYSFSKDMPVLFGINILITLLDGLSVPIMIIVVARFIDVALLVGTNNFIQGDLFFYGVLLMLGYVYVSVNPKTPTYISFINIIK